MFDVVALGEVLIDFTCVDTDAQGYPTLSAHPGGATANFLAALAGLGAKTAHLGKVGNDAFGRLLLGTLEKAGINTKGMVISDEVFTTLAFVTLDERGERDFSFARKPGADTCIEFDELDLEIIDQAKVFHIGTLSLTDEPARMATYRAVAYAKSKGKWITCDPNLRKPLWKDLQDAKEQLLWALSQADVIKISDDEVRFLFDMTPEEGAAYIVGKFGVKLVFVTCGAEGCFYKNPMAEGRVAALRGVNVVDTTGAGDIFGGSAVYRLLRTGTDPDKLSGKQLDEIVKFACIAASLSTTRPGGISSVPTIDEIEKFL